MSDGSRLVKRAFAEVPKLPDQEQKTIAAWILEELASGERWERDPADSEDALARLADEALAEQK